LFDEHETLWTRTEELIKSCGCQEGCPSCVGPSRGPGEGVKELTLTLLGYLISNKLQTTIH
ncbi:MAG TPA: hypothetical protein VKZ59_09910, partial [Acidobacteriota bacterium]|nr:hypothetical protein [Acidobacteriota bacterium]